MKHTILFLFITLLLSCSKKNVTIPHEGLILKNQNITFTDTIPLSMDSCSKRGNFFVWNDQLCFADVYYNKVFVFNTDNGRLQRSFFGKGSSKSEISNMMCMYGIEDGKDAFYLNSSNVLYTFSDSTKINYHGIIDFGWKH